MIKAVIFDCFGVLMVEARQSFAEKHSDKFDEIKEIIRQADSGLIDRADQLKAYADITGENPELIESYLLNEHRLNEPLVEMIKALKSSYKIGMISNIGTDWYSRLVPKDVRELFDQTILSGDVGMVKPYPEIFEFALEKMELLPSETIFIDDILDNCEGAKAIGIEAVFYKSVATATQTLSKYGVNI